MRAFVGTVKRCVDLLVPLTKGEPAAESAEWSAARSATQSAASAAWSADSAAYSLMADKLESLLQAAKP